jgi:hypothetical protein
VDRICHEILIPRGSVEKMLRALDLVYRDYPNQRLPVHRDNAAWLEFLGPVVPSDCEASPETFAAICTGKGRRYIWDKIQPGNLGRYLEREVVDDETSLRDNGVGFRPTSFIHSSTLKCPAYNPFTSSSPLAALAIPKSRFEQALLELEV